MLNADVIDYKSCLRLQDNFDLDFLNEKVFLHRDQTDLNHCQDDKENSWTCHIILELGIRLLPIVQLCVESSKAEESRLQFTLHRAAFSRMENSMW